MLTVFLGLLTAITYGFADFFGAIASKRIKPVVVTGAASFIGLLLLLALAPFIGADFSPAAVSTGVLAGIASAFALTCLYAALAIGPISIVSPLTALLSAIVPMVVGVWLGDRFSTLGWIALLLILISVTLVALIPGEAAKLPSLRGTLFAVGAGVGIGFVLIAVDASPADSGIATIIVLRTVGALILAGASLVIWLRSKRLTLDSPGSGINKRILLAVAVTGIFDSLANIFFTLAIREGSLSVVAVLTALYPVGTILLARFVLKEKLAGVQSVGIAIAIGASTLLALA